MTRLVFFLHVSCVCVVTALRHVDRIELPTSSIGTRRHLLVYSYTSATPPVDATATKRAYLQASLHADELPGMLVINHLLKLLDRADRDGHILQTLDLVPFANPVGLSQQLMGMHVGRFSVDTGVNFNREYPDVVDAVAQRLAGTLSATDATANVAAIRAAMREEIAAVRVPQEEAAMKQALYLRAAGADVVLDLHCDSSAVLHMYTHDRLWPQTEDLAREMGLECQLLAPAAGGNPFDEACSCPWAELADRFPGCPIPMACEAVTVELRGDTDVYDELAVADAAAIFRFLQRRGYISEKAVAVAGAEAEAGAGAEAEVEVGMDGVATTATKAASAGASLPPLPPLLRPATPLTGVDMVEAPCAGVVAWRVQPGQEVRAGQLMGEVVDCADPFAPRAPVVARTSGVVFAMSRHKLVRPGGVIAKVAGAEPLPWRTGKLLTSR